MADSSSGYIIWHNRADSDGSARASDTFVGCSGRHLDHFRIWRVARDVIGISGGLAVGFIIARILLDGLVNMATGFTAPIS